MWVSGDLELNDAAYPRSHEKVCSAMEELTSRSRRSRREWFSGLQGQLDE